MLTDLTPRFFHVGTGYRYDWRVTLGTGEVLLVKAAPLTTDSDEQGSHPTMIVVDAKWQGPAFGLGTLDSLIGQRLPLASSGDPWITVLTKASWVPYSRV